MDCHNDNDDDQLAELMAKLHVRDVLRSKKVMAMPDPALVLEFDNLACSLMKRQKQGQSETARIKRITAHFGAPPLVIAKLWELLIQHHIMTHRLAKKHHLLWALHYLVNSDSPPDECGFRSKASSC